MMERHIKACFEVSALPGGILRDRGPLQPEGESWLLVRRSGRIERANLLICQAALRDSMEMNSFAQLGIILLAVPSAGKYTVASLFLLVAGRALAISLPLQAFYLCLSAAAGALLYRICAQARNAQHESASARELTMLRAVTANLPDPLYVKDREGRFLMANQGAADNNGAACSNDLLGKTDYDFFPSELARSFWEDERKVILDGQPQISKEECITESGRKTRWVLSTKVPLRDSAGRIIGLVGVGRNISALKEVEAELKMARDELAFKAAHDSLTSLLSRGAILEMLGRELARSARESGRTAVLLGDLDLFKHINDIYGHPVGDEVLREVAHRLLSTVRPYDLVGRFGGEEFLIVMPGCGAADATARADQLREVIAGSPVKTARGPIPITISLGVLLVQEWGRPSSDEVLREVDTALYASKAAGRNRCSVAHPPAGYAALAH